MHIELASYGMTPQLESSFADRQLADWHSLDPESSGRALDAPLPWRWRILLRQFRSPLIYVLKRRRHR